MSGKPLFLRGFLCRKTKFSELRIGWLGRLDSNQGMAESKSAALPLGYAPSAMWLDAGDHTGATGQVNVSQCKEPVGGEQPVVQVNLSKAPRLEFFRAFPALRPTRRLCAGTLSDP